MSQKIPPLEHAYRGFTHEVKHQALVTFTQQASTHFPEILDSKRDKAAIKIHIDNIESHLSRSNQDTQAIINALNSITKIAEKKQTGMRIARLHRRVNRND